MDRDRILDQIAAAMIRYDEGDPRRIQHFLKVHALARLIGREEGLDPVTLFRLECAAYVHDIGIHEGERHYGRNDGYIQEKLGPGEAEKLLAPLGLDDEDEKRILWLVGHHHSYGSIDGADAQILAEADMIVNAYEDQMEDKQKEALYRRLFKTKSGRALFDAMYFHHYEGSRHA